MLKDTLNNLNLVDNCRLVRMSIHNPSGAPEYTFAFDLYTSKPFEEEFHKINFTGLEDDNNYMASLYDENYQNANTPEISQEFD